MIRIVPYDSRWPDCFASEANHLRAAMGRLSLRIEHVGSTSVPGLAAKPVIDIQISVATLDGLDVYVAPLASLGYRHVPFGDVDLVYPFFRKPAEWPSTHHIHLCVSDSEHERRTWRSATTCATIHKLRTNMSHSSGAWRQPTWAQPLNRVSSIRSRRRSSSLPCCIGRCRDTPRPPTGADACRLGSAGRCVAEPLDGRPVAV